MEDEQIRARIFYTRRVRLGAPAARRKKSRKIKAGRASGAAGVFDFCLAILVLYN